MAPVRLKLLTLNCWGMPVIDGLPYLCSKDKPERIRAIANQLRRSDYDVVCLQEVWSRKDFEVIRNEVIDTLPHHVYFQSGYFGTGLVILSKEPIMESLFLPYPLNGYVHHLHTGNYFVGVGVGLVRISINSLTVSVYCSHLHCKYDVGNPEDLYTPHRTLQSFQLAQIIRNTCAHSDVVILLGDMNLRESELGYKVIVSLAELNDTVHQRSDQATDADNTTIDRPSNIYTPEELRNLPGERIDYIFYRTGQNVKATVTSCSTTFDKIAGSHLNYSDHQGVQAELQISREQSERKIDVDGKFDRRVVVLEALKSFESRLKGIQRDQKFHFGLSVVLFLAICLLACCSCGHLAYVVQTGLKFTMAFCIYYATLGLRYEAKIYQQTLQEANLIQNHIRNS